MRLHKKLRPQKKFSTGDVKWCRGVSNKADRLQLARSLDDAVEVIILIVPAENQLNRRRDNTRDPRLDAVILFSDLVLVAWKKQAFVSFYNAMNAAPEAYHCRTDLECIKPPKTIYPGGLIVFKILYMSCRKWRDWPLYFWLGGGGWAIFYRSIFSWLTELWRPWPEFYFTSLQYTSLLCAAMCDFYLFCKSFAGNFFRICPVTPSKIKWCVPNIKQRQDSVIWVTQFLLLRSQS